MGHDETLDEIDIARAGLYRLLGALLARPPDAARLAAVATLDGDASELGTALRAAAAAARAITPDAAQREYDALFIGMTRGEVVPYASFYLTGFLYDRPLVRIRADMAELGVESTDAQSEPEDHIATILQVMSSLIDGAATPRQDPARQNEFFRRHLEPWAARFFADLERAPAAVLYRPVGALGRVLMAVEQRAFQMEFA